jgi:metal-responsive CopG/Arc/MetJ family transcriptional regulator|nr:MAG TPA: antitoxin [Caudoviricetes sp.]
MKDYRATVRFDEELKEAIEGMAKEKDIPVSQLIREAVKWYMAQFNNKEK